MTPSDLYSATLTVLTSARAAMLSAEWQAALGSASQDQRIAASRELIQVQQAILALSNASLSDIVEEIQQNQEALSQATGDLTRALNDIKKVQNVIDGVSKVVSLVGKILPLL